MKIRTSMYMNIRVFDQAMLTLMTYGTKICSLTLVLLRASQTILERVCNNGISQGDRVARSDLVVMPWHPHNGIDGKVVQLLVGRASFSGQSPESPRAQRVKKRSDLFQIGSGGKTYRNLGSEIEINKKNIHCVQQLKQKKKD